MMPPANTSTSSSAASAELVTIVGISVMCAPESTDSPTASASSCSAASATCSGRLEQARVDDLEPRIAQGPCDHFGAPIVSVQPGLGDDDAVASQHRLTLAKDSPGPLVATARSRSADIKLLAAATIGVLLAGFLIAGAALVATRGSENIVCPQLQVGSATDVRKTLQNGGPYFNTGGAQCGFWLALDNDNIVAYTLDPALGLHPEAQA